ncbi:MAG: DUF177 domain-containing protein [Chloroflexi bacterium]|nr:DUF177 domain-containing protein [Chloroflexota bacterium]
MIYNVAQLFKENIGATQRRYLSGELMDLDELNPGPTSVEGAVVLMRTRQGVLAQVKAQMRAYQECRRCLEPLRADLELAFEEEFLPTIDINTGLRIVPEEDADPVLQIDDHHLLDLEELIRQYALVELSEGHLCSADCKGLCDHCGANLNTEECRCEPDAIDPRLAELGKFFSLTERITDDDPSTETQAQ